MCSQVLASETIDSVLTMVRSFRRILPLDAFRPLFQEMPRGPEMAGIIMAYKPLQKARCASVWASKWA